MLSRATSLENLLVLPPFDPKKLCSHASEDFRSEMKRLDILACHTILNSQNDWDRHFDAQCTLDHLLTQHLPTHHNKHPAHSFTLSDDDCDDSTDCDSSSDDF
jgi:hypothetical protein